jgi:hypothetical protein
VSPALLAVHRGRPTNAARRIANRRPDTVDRPVAMRASRSLSPGSPAARLPNAPWKSSDSSRSQRGPVDRARRAPPTARDRRDERCSRCRGPSVGTNRMAHLFVPRGGACYTSAHCPRLLRSHGVGERLGQRASWPRSSFHRTENQERRRTSAREQTNVRHSALLAEDMQADRYGQ